MTPGELLPQVYKELRRLAAAKLATEKPGQRFVGSAEALKGAVVPLGHRQERIP
jgi:hypothetical protein